MLDKIIEKIDFKWWSSLESQQKLTVGMAIIIVTLFGINLYQYRNNEINKMQADTSKEAMRLSLRIEIEQEKASKESCYESQILYLQENEKRYQQLFFDYVALKDKIKEQ